MLIFTKVDVIRNLLNTIVSSVSVVIDGNRDILLFEKVNPSLLPWNFVENW